MRCGFKFKGTCITTTSGIELKEVSFVGWNDRQNGFCVRKAITVPMRLTKRSDCIGAWRMYHYRSCVIRNQTDTILSILRIIMWLSVR